MVTDDLNLADENLQELQEDDTQQQSGSGEDEHHPDEDTGVVVSIGESPDPESEEPHGPAPAWVKELRQSHRELTRRNRELQEQLEAAKPAPQQQSLGQKPTLEGLDYDADRYEQALAAWYEQKRAVDDQAAQAEAKRKAEAEAWQTKLTSYGEAKKKLKVRDFEDAETVVQTTLNQTQQGIILQGAEDPALLVYALGRNPGKAKELASITDPVKYAFAVAKLETQLKITNRKAPPPESSVKPGTASASGIDSQLDRLRQDAEKTGDYSKVIAYKRQKRKS